MVDTVNQSRMRYTGTRLPVQGEKNSKTGRIIRPYFPSPELVEVVNLAIYLEKPLLIRGEPGCGKTMLAHDIAYELKLALETWNIKSISKARDGLYTYDLVGRLRDAQLASSDFFSKEDIQKIRDPSSYLGWGALGRAFKSIEKCVVLIDEIDKADFDFPNDLLFELDEKRFYVEETGEEIQSKHSPIVIITSNGDRDLPDAFLRRCLFHYVEFPDSQCLIEIVKAFFPSASEKLVEKAISRFLELRKRMQSEKGDLAKKVSTSELIDWFDILQNHPQDEVLSKLDGKLPFAGVLLKSWEDHLRYVLGDKRQHV